MTCKCGFRLNMPDKKCGRDGKRPEGDLPPAKELLECLGCFGYGKSGTDDLGHEVNCWYCGGTGLRSKNML